jgi:hypothetical protein
MAHPRGLLLLKERPKLISPIHIVRMSLLQRHELLTRRGCIAPKLRQEINNSALLGDLPFRDIQLSNSLNEIIHDGLSVHSPPAPPVIRPRWWFSHTAELREALNFSVCYAAVQGRRPAAADISAKSSGMICLGTACGRTTVKLPDRFRKPAASPEQVRGRLFGIILYADAGRCALRKERIWRTAMGIRSFGSFHG